MMKAKFSDKSLSACGTDRIEVPPEIREYWKGNGISPKFLREHYGLGSSLNISPKPSRVKTAFGF